MSLAALLADNFRRARLIEAAHPISAGPRKQKACFDCHALFAEGARFAMELGKVWLKYVGGSDPASVREALKGWFALA